SIPLQGLHHQGLAQSSENKATSNHTQKQHSVQTSNGTKMFLKQAFALVALLATTGILAAPSPYENKDSEGPKGVKGYDFDHKGYDFDHKGYDFDHKGIEYRGNHKPAYPYNFCGWGYKYYDHEKECRVERCPSGKAFWDKEKKCN
ncbi:hypothetical protein DM02DRAFT_706299, partial [Periconia macrospinosa]